MPLLMSGFSRLGKALGDLLSTKILLELQRSQLPYDHIHIILLK
jgi:hypothetical protein